MMNTSKAASYICTTRHLKRERNLHPTLLPRMINMKQQEHGTCHETSLFRPFLIHILQSKQVKRTPQDSINELII